MNPSLLLKSIVMQFCQILHGEGLAKQNQHVVSIQQKLQYLKKLVKVREAALRQKVVRCKLRKVYTLTMPHIVHLQQTLKPNAPCYCGSKRKYKKCCHIADLNLVAGKDLAQERMSKQEARNRRRAQVPRHSKGEEPKLKLKLQLMPKP